MAQMSYCSTTSLKACKHYERSAVRTARIIKAKLPVGFWIQCGGIAVGRNRPHSAIHGGDWHVGQFNISRKQLLKAAKKMSIIYVLIPIAVSAYRYRHLPVSLGGKNRAI